MNRAGSGFIHKDKVFKTRIRDGSSTLQAELYAIKAALTHALLLQESHVYILTDSLAALQVLQKESVSDNIALTTAIHFKITQLKDQEKSVSFMWIPSHVGIKGNEAADKAAKDSLQQHHLKLIKPSLSNIKSRARETTKEISKIQHQVWVQAGSPSATWYSIATDYIPITIPKSMSRRDAVIIHRLRLGYRCNWEIQFRVPKACSHCHDIVEEPLIHYILECPVLNSIRSRHLQDIPHNQEELLQVAALSSKTFLESEERFKIISRFPPPR
ncbi:uncharacterized protein LOC134767451 [Penaeus indicus]|uniref:uncharacterized protein LOC134767451 n=1 Tax=Penaeus indicus TaxID=29960 RepID=UPI00300DBC2C